MNHIPRVRVTFAIDGKVLTLLTASLHFRDKPLPTGRQGDFRYKIFFGIPAGSQ